MPDRVPDRAPDRVPDRDSPPVHRQPRVLLAVAAGAVLGGPARHALELALPATGSGLPVGTLVVNLVGCLLLGTLVEALALRSVPDSFATRYARPFAGPGLLGTFTTYSTFTVQTDRLLLTGRAGVAAAYVLASLLGGAAAAALGVLAARHAWPGGGRPDRRAVR